DSRLLQHRGIKTRIDPSLIFSSELSWCGDAGHAKYHCGQVINAGKIVDILVRSPLGTAVWRMKVQWLRFRNALVFGIAVTRFGENWRPKSEITVNLVRGSKKNKGL